MEIARRSDDLVTRAYALEGSWVAIEEAGSLAEGIAVSDELIDLGARIGDPDWSGQSRALAFQMLGWHGQPDFYVMFNAHWETQRFHIPPHDGQWRWRRLVDTHLPSPDDILDEDKDVEEIRKFLGRVKIAEGARASEPRVAGK